MSRNAMHPAGHRNLVLIAHRTSFEAYIEAFENLGYEVCADVVEPTPAQLDRAVLYLTSLYSAVRHPLHAMRVKRRLKAAGVPMIGWDRDAPWHMGRHVRRLKLLAWLRPLDIYATHTLQPTYDFAPLKHYNANAVWVRHFNLHGRTLEEMRDPAFFRWDVSFVGNMNGARFKEHAERQRFFTALRPRLEALGLRVLFCNSGGMSEQEQIDVIQRSVINLNYRSSCDHRSRAGVEMSWGLPERCYGVPARGGFMLSDERRHAADDFDLATEWASYRDFEDCIARIQYFCNHFAETRAIAEAAHRRVMRDHTYEKRAEALLAVAAEWRAKIAARRRWSGVDRSSNPNPQSVCAEPIPMTPMPDHRPPGAVAPADTFRSQNGEDRWLDDFFGHKRSGFFVDVGAYDGVDLSNSYHFEQLGWTGILVEPDPDRAAHCVVARPRSRTFHCAAVASPALTEITFHRVDSAGVFSTTHLTEQHASRLANMGCAPKPITVPARTLDSMLQDVGAERIDFVSIDVEGAELDVLRGFDIARWQPAIVVIESNTKLRQPAIRDYFVRHGYAYRHSIDVNDFYQRLDAGAMQVRLIDALNYARHRVRRRLARLSHNLRRAWKKLAAP